MAQPIYFDNFARELRANAAAAPWEAAGQAIQGVAGGIEKVLFDVQQRKEQEKARRLTAMAALVSKYGFSGMGSDFARQWETDSGIKFSRGPDGKPIVPKSYEEEINQHRKDFVQKHPEYEASSLDLGKPPMSADEKKYADLDVDLARERNRIEEKRYALESSVRMAAIVKDKAPSGWAYNPQTKELENVGPGKGMSNMDFDNAKEAVQTQLLKEDAKYKKAQIRYLLHKGETGDLIDKLAVPAFKVLFDPKVKDQGDRRHAYETLSALAKRNGETMPFTLEETRKRGFFSWLKEMAVGEQSSKATAQDKPLTPEEEVKRWEEANP